MNRRITKIIAIIAVVAMLASFFAINVTADETTIAASGYAAIGIVDAEAHKAEVLLGTGEQGTVYFNGAAPATGAVYAYTRDENNLYTFVELLANVDKVSQFSSGRPFYWTKQGWTWDPSGNIFFPYSQPLFVRFGNNGWAITTIYQMGDNPENKTVPGFALAFSSTGDANRYNAGTIVYGALKNDGTVDTTNFDIAFPGMSATNSIGAFTNPLHANVNMEALVLETGYAAAGAVDTENTVVEILKGTGEQGFVKYDGEAPVSGVVYRYSRSYNNIYTFTEPVANHGYSSQIDLSKAGWHTWMSAAFYGGYMWDSQYNHYMAEATTPFFVHTSPDTWILTNQSCIVSDTNTSRVTYQLDVWVRDAANNYYNTSAVVFGGRNADGTIDTTGFDALKLPETSHDLSALTTPLHPVAEPEVPETPVVPEGYEKQKIDLTGTVVGACSGNSETAESYSDFVWWSDGRPDWKPLGNFVDNDLTTTFSFGASAGERSDLYLDLSKNDNGYTAIDEFTIYHGSQGPVPSIMVVLVLADGTEWTKTYETNWEQYAGNVELTETFKETQNAVGMYIWQNGSDKAHFGDIMMYQYIATEEPEATEPEVTEPEVTEPEVTEPEVTEPEVTEPEVTEPEVTEPEVTEPEATEPEVTEPEATEPEATEPESNGYTASGNVVETGYAAIGVVDESLSKVQVLLGNGKVGAVYYAGEAPKSGTVYGYELHSNNVFVFIEKAANFGNSNQSDYNTAWYLWFTPNGWAWDANSPADVFHAPYPIFLNYGDNQWVLTTLDKVAETNGAAAAFGFVLDPVRDMPDVDAGNGLSNHHAGALVIDAVREDQYAKPAQLFGAAGDKLNLGSFTADLYTPSAKTGDASPIVAVVVAALFSIGAIGYVVSKKKEF